MGLRRAVLLAAVFLVPNLGFAANLFEVYQQAAYSDPIFKSAQAQYLSVRENVSIAGSQLLPNINITGSTQRQLIKQRREILTSVPVPGFSDFNFNQTFYNTNNTYSLNITQPLFNEISWRALKNAQIQVKQAQANFCAAAQDLMVRTAQAYFNVLQANDFLNFTILNEKALKQRYYQMGLRYKMKMASDADLQDVKASYIAATADEISARNALADAMDSLRIITGKKYDNLMGADAVPLLRPNPAKLDKWLAIAEKQNYELLAAQYAAEAAQQGIKLQSAAHYPVVNFSGGYQFQHLTNNQQLGFFPGVYQAQSGLAGVTVAMPVYQGGLVSAKTKQASYQYEQALEQLELAHRKVLATTENAYLNIITDIRKIAADKQIILAREKTLRATQYAYDKNMRTILDVLNMQSALYQAKINYSRDRYDYLLNTFILKQAAGMLNTTDVVNVNAMFRSNNRVGVQLAKIY